MKANGTPSSERSEAQPTVRAGLGYGHQMVRAEMSGWMFP